MNRKTFLKSLGIGAIVSSLLMTLNGCNKKPVSLNNSLITHMDISNIMQANQLYATNKIIYDAEYRAVSEEWIEKEFAPKYFEYLTKNNLWTFHNNTNDCDDFAGRARLFAQQLNNESSNGGVASLAFGEIHYVRSTINGGGAHAVNFGIVKTKEGKNSIVFFEPQKCEIVVLTRAEFTSIISFII